MEAGCLVNYKEMNSAGIFLPGLISQVTAKILQKMTFVAFLWTSEDSKQCINFLNVAFFKYFLYADLMHLAHKNSTDGGIQ